MTAYEHKLIRIALEINEMKISRSHLHVVNVKREFLQEKHPMTKDKRNTKPQVYLLNVSDACYVVTLFVLPSSFAVASCLLATHPMICCNV